MNPLEKGARPNTVTTAKQVECQLALGRNFAQIGELLNVTPERVRQLALTLGVTGKANNERLKAERKRQALLNHPVRGEFIRQLEQRGIKWEFKKLPYRVAGRDCDLRLSCFALRNKLVQLKKASTLGSQGYVRLHRVFQLEEFTHVVFYLSRSVWIILPTSRIKHVNGTSFCLETNRERKRRSDSVDYPKYVNRWDLLA
jgi:hypothetical protein